MMKKVVYLNMIILMHSLQSIANDQQTDTITYNITGSNISISTHHEVIMLDSANIYTLMWQEDSTLSVQLQGMKDYAFDEDEEMWQESLLLSDGDSLRAILRIFLLITQGELVELTDLDNLPLGYKGIRVKWTFETNGIEVKNNYTILLNNNYSLFIALTASENVLFSTLNQRAENLFSELQFAMP
jgi:hypothetical protein